MVLLKSYLFNIDGQSLNEQVNLEDDVDNKAVFNGNKMLDNVGCIDDLESLLSLNMNNNNNNNTILGTKHDVFFEKFNKSICSLDLSYNNNNNEFYDILRKCFLDNYVQEFDFNNNTKSNNVNDDNLLNHKVNMYNNLEANEIVINNENLKYNLDTYEHKCSSCNDYLDIGDVLWKPISHLDDSYLNFNKNRNELTQSYKALIDDLCKINYHTYDHFSMNEEEIIFNGLNINYLHALLSGSYYGLGYFEPDSFFKNTFQCLYDVKELKNELNELFKDDKYYEDWKNKIELCAAANKNKFGISNKGDQLLNGNKTKIKELVKSRWDYVSTRSLHSSTSDTTKQSPTASPTVAEKGSILISEIIERMNCKNSIGLFLPKDKELNQKPETNSLSETLRLNQNAISHVCGVTASTSSRHWTVAPNLFVINENHYSENKMNTIAGGKVNKKNRDYAKSLFLNNFEKQVDPIGKKPLSMSFTQQNYANDKTDKNKRLNSSQNKNYSNKVFQGFTNNPERLFEKTEYSIWKHEDILNNNNESSNKYFTPFLHYNYKIASPIVINKPRINKSNDSNVFYRNRTISNTQNNNYYKPSSSSSSSSSSSTYNTHELHKQPIVNSQQQDFNYKVHSVSNNHPTNNKYKYRKNKNEYSRSEDYRAYDCNEMFSPVSSVYLDSTGYDDGINFNQKHYQYQNYHKKPTKNPYKYTRYQSLN